jgi:hypothetical protein
MMLRRALREPGLWERARRNPRIALLVAAHALAISRREQKLWQRRMRKAEAGPNGLSSFPVRKGRPRQRSIRRMPYTSAVSGFR